MPDGRPARSRQQASSNSTEVGRPPLRQIARTLLELRPQGDWLLDQTPGCDFAYVLLLEMIWHHPRRVSFVGLSDATGIPLPDVFRAVTALARKGMIEFESDALLLREHHVGLSETARTQVEAHLRHAASTMLALFQAQAGAAP